MDSIPTLAMSDEGKKAVINDMRLFANGWIHKKKVADKLAQAYKGHLPYNFKQLVDDASKPYMEKIKQQFLDTNLQKIEV